MKKILFVINTMGRAGAEKSLISLLRSFDYSRASVSLLSIIGRGELFSEVPGEVAILNTRASDEPVLGVRGVAGIAGITLLRIFKRGYIFKFIPYAIKNIATQLKRGCVRMDKLLWLPLSETAPLLEEEYDLAIAFIEGSATYYVADKVKAKKKLAFVHVNYEMAGYIKEHDKEYYRKMDYICCISDAVRKTFNKVYPEYADKARLFPNIIVPEDIRSGANEGGGFSDGFNGLRILTVARLHPQKGLDIAVPAFARLVRQGYSGVRWYVLGDGTERARLKRLIAEYGLEGKFILLSSRANPYPYMTQSDIYVQPSRFEGFPLTLQEALILNKPCITTDFDGVCGLLHDGDNALIIRLSEENIVGALKTLIDDKDLRERLADATKRIRFDFPNKLHALYSIMDGLYWSEKA